MRSLQALCVLGTLMGSGGIPLDSSFLLPRRDFLSDVPPMIEGPINSTDVSSRRLLQTSCAQNQVLQSSSCVCAASYYGNPSIISSITVTTDNVNQNWARSCGLSGINSCNVLYSSMYSSVGQPASNLNDGNINTWTSPQESANSWLAIDFGTVRQVTSGHVWNFQSNCKDWVLTNPINHPSDCYGRMVNFKIYVGNSSTTYANNPLCYQDSGDNISNAKYSFSQNFTCNAVGRYAFIQRDQNNFLPPGELEFHGPSCTFCPSGSYCPAGSTAMIQCPANSYCPEGSSAPTLCPTFHTSPASSKSLSACLPPQNSSCPNKQVWQSSSCVCAASYYGNPSIISSITVTDNNVNQNWARSCGSSGKDPCNVFSSSIYDGVVHPPFHLNDGKLDTWFGTQKLSNSWLAIDFGTVRQVTSGHVRNRLDTCVSGILSDSFNAPSDCYGRIANFKIYVGNSSTTYANNPLCYQDSGDNISQAKYGWSQNFTCNAVGRYAFIHRDQQNYLKVAELELHGPPCTFCPSGSYCPAGSTAMIQCPANSYCPAGSTAPTICPANSYCPKSSASPVACPTNTLSVAGSGSCVARPGYFFGNTLPPNGQRLLNGQQEINGITYGVAWSSNDPSGPSAYSVINNFVQSLGPIDAWCTRHSYDPVTGKYIEGLYSTTIDGIVYPGEWMQFITSTPIQLNAYDMGAADIPGRTPKSFMLCGSNDGTTWTLLSNVSNQINWQGASALRVGEIRLFPVQPWYTGFTIHRLVVTTIVGGFDGHMKFARLSFNTTTPTTCTASTACATGTTLHCQYNGSGVGTGVCCGSTKPYFVEGTSTTCQSCPVGTFYNASNNQCSSCPTGSYCFNSSVALCPANSYCPQGASTPTLCPAEKLSSAGSTSLSQCQTSYVSLNITISGASTDLQQSQFQNALPSNIVIQSFDDALVVSTDSCNPGYYCPAGGTAPVPCPAGTYNPDPNSALLSNCLTCQQGGYCPIGSPAPTSCAAGSYMIGTGGAQQSDCTVCTTGNYCPLGSITPTNCSAGTYNPSTGGNATESCLPCPEGVFCPIATTTPTACAAGSYRGSTGAAQQSDCAACTTGNYCPIQSINPTNCTPGTYNPSTRGASADDCLSCPVGQYCPLATTTPTSCAAGSYRGSTGAAQQGDCTICITGNYCPIQSVNPTNCTPGTYNPSTGGSSAADCLACPVGQYCPLAATTTPTSCAAGSYRGSTGAAQQADCATCPTGNYCPIQSVNPTNCTPGTYNPSVGGTSPASCLSCPAGDYCPGATTTPVDCSANTFSLASAPNCSVCPAYSTSPIASANCTCGAGHTQTVTVSGGGGGSAAVSYTVVGVPNYGGILGLPAAPLVGALTINGYSNITVLKGTVLTLTSTPYSGSPINMFIYSSLPDAKSNPYILTKDEIDTNYSPNAFVLVQYDLLTMTSLSAVPTGYTAGITGTGTASLVWDTTNAAPGMYYLASPRTKSATGIQTYLTIFIASPTPVTLSFPDPALTMSAVAIMANVGDSVILRTNSADNVVYVYCGLIADSTTASAVIVAQGPSPFTWNTASINPATQYCNVMATDGRWASALFLNPRPAVVSAGGGSSTLSCPNCTSGYYSNAGDSSCTTCGYGYYSPPVSAACTICPLGTKCNSTTTPEPVPCGLGAFQPSTGASFCSTCPTDKYCPSTTTSSPSSCPQHTASVEGSSSLLNCRCVNGFFCTYTKRITATVTLNTTLSNFNSDLGGVQTAFKAAVAAAAGVLPAKVTINGVAQKAGARRLLSYTPHLIDVRTTIHGAERLRNLEGHLARHDKSLHHSHTWEESHSLQSTKVTPSLRRTGAV